MIISGHFQGRDRKIIFLMTSRVFSFLPIKHCYDNGFVVVNNCFIQREREREITGF